MDIPSIIVLVLIVGILAAIIIKGIFNKKNGKSSCSCGCSGCALKDTCHSKKE